MRSVIPSVDPCAFGTSPVGMTKGGQNPYTGVQLPLWPHTAKECPDGVIGSRAALKMLCRKACRFESDSGHKIKKTIAFGVIVFLFLTGLERERDRENGSFPVVEVLEPQGFKKFRSRNFVRVRLRAQNKNPANDGVFVLECDNFIFGE